MPRMSKQSLELRTFLAVMLLNLVVIIAISAFFQRRTLTFFEQEFTGALYTQASEAGRGIDSAYQSLYQTATDAAYDTRLIGAIAAGDEGQLSQILRDYKNKNPLASRVSYYSKPSGAAMELPDAAGAAMELKGAAGKNYRIVRSDEYQSSYELTAGTAAAIEQALANQQGRRPLRTTEVLGPAPESIYLYAQAVHDGERTLGYIIVTASERQLYYSELARQSEGDSSALLYTEAGELLSASPLSHEVTDDLGGRIAAAKEGEARITAAGTDYLAVWLELPFSGSVLCLLRSQAGLQSQLMSMQLLCILAALVLLLISDVFLYLIATRLVGPVEVQKRAAELNALQYQIRPHFIYNMLNAIRFAATLQGAKNIADRLADFVELLRASTNRQGSFTNLTGELKALRHYVALQEFRLLDAFAVEFDIEPAAGDCIVPRMILQPLVENSILHGPSEERPFCHILVAAYLEDAHLVLVVQDDGQGMSESDIAAVTAGEQRELSHGGLSGIGTASIIERLRLYYGERASLTYESDGMSYTTARLVLPVSHDVHEYDIGGR